MRQITITYDINANEKSCGNCHFIGDYRDKVCSLFNEKTLKQRGHTYLRLHECKQAEAEALKTNNQ